VILPKPEWFREAQLDAQWVLRATTDEQKLDDWILAMKDQVESIIKKAIRDKDPYWLKTEDGLLMFKNCLYVPDDRSLRTEIIARNPDSLLAGHPDAQRTQELIKQHWWWPTVAREAREYVTGCETCQQTKADRHKKASLLVPNADPGKWYHGTWSAHSQNAEAITPSWS
jgi:hypothetical protein